MVTSVNQTMLDKFELLATRSGEYTCRVTMSGCLDRLLGEENITGSTVSPTTDKLFKVNPKAEMLDKNEQ